MKIHVFDLEDWEREAFDSLGEEHEMTRTADPLTAENAVDHAEAEAISVFIYSPVDAEIRLAAAGLDVLPEEPVVREEAELLRSVYERRHDLEALLADQVLIRMGNVVVTPHSAFRTREAVGRILDTTIANLRSFAEGEPTHRIVER